jgi:hypothetical protein
MGAGSVSFKRVAQGHHSVSATNPQHPIDMFRPLTAVPPALASAESGQREPEIKPMGQHFGLGSPQCQASKSYRSRSLLWFGRLYQPSLCAY